MVDKNIIVNNPTLKADSYFVVADSKTQEGDKVSNDDQHELFQQSPLCIDCNTPENVALSDSSDNIQEKISSNIQQYPENPVKQLELLDNHHSAEISVI